ncbi:MAG: tetratricopeptide repeat protein, partial [Melioribacter sp.]|nr:tetratricopeptide repeat protein [Melioribacter sp.]
IRLKPNHANSYYGKAKINFLLSQTQEAIECLKKTFELDPNIRNEFTRDYPEVKSSKLFTKLLDDNKS